ncbi:hydrolase [Capnocytophaga canimorsus]|uniref:hydrolase n=1 Tax=Capnocytophaga canimorsus TaxID=28188 RepID=UPI00385F61F0
MKKNVFLYLFVFSVLFNVYQYVNGKRYFTENQKEIVKKDKKLQQIDALQDSIRTLLIEKSDFGYFSLENNGFGTDFFKEIGLEKPTDYITSKLLETNIPKGKHPLINYEPSNLRFQINKIRVLNHRWIICDFTDGANWGELLLQYEIKDNKEITFSVLGEILYPKDTY